MKIIEKLSLDGEQILKDVCEVLQRHTTQKDGSLTDKEKDNTFS